MMILKSPLIPLLFCTVAPECDVYVSFRDVHTKSASDCYLSGIRMSLLVAYDRNVRHCREGPHGIRLAQSLSAFSVYSLTNYSLEERYLQAHTARRLGGKCGLFNNIYLFRIACLFFFSFHLFLFIYFPLYIYLFYFIRPVLSFWTIYIYMIVSSIDRIMLGERDLCSCIPRYTYRDYSDLCDNYL